MVKPMAWPLTRANKELACFRDDCEIMIDFAIMRTSDTLNPS